MVSSGEQPPIHQRTADSLLWLVPAIVTGDPSPLPATSLRQQSTVVSSNRIVPWVTITTYFCGCENNNSDACQSCGERKWRRGNHFAAVKRTLDLMMKVWSFSLYLPIFMQSFLFDQCCCQVENYFRSLILVCFMTAAALQSPVSGCRSLALVGFIIIMLSGVTMNNKKCGETENIWQEASENVVATDLKSTSSSLSPHYSRVCII